MIEIVDAFITILAYLLTFPPVRSGSNNCLALLKLVAIGDFRSPTFIGGYWKKLAMERMISWNLTMCDE